MRASSWELFSTVSQRLKRRCVSASPEQSMNGERSHSIWLFSYAPSFAPAPRSVPQTLLPLPAGTVGSPDLPAETLTPTWLDSSQLSLPETGLCVQPAGPVSNPTEYEVCV